tara:strand:- start:174 stop:575 length:402 start_codon:yes stop_codon:yes gene_type:complete
MDKDISTVRARLDKGKPYKSRLVEAIALQPEKSLQETDGSMRLWPTPTAHPENSNKNGKFKNLTLGDAVQQWPTPRSNSAMASLITPEIANNPKRFPNLETVVGRTEQVTGRLNPTWVEWLMGFPLGWTDLED